MHITDIPAPYLVTAGATADNTSISVLWEWSRQGLLMCLDGVRVDCQPEGLLISTMYTVDSATATSATVSNLTCNTQYTISVLAYGGRIGIRSLGRVVSLPARGIVYHSFFWGIIIHSCNPSPSSPSHSH